MSNGMGQERRRQCGWKARAGLLILLAGFLWLMLTLRQPSHHGKSLGFWLTRATDGSAGGFYDDLENAQVTECRDAIRSIGTNAIPTLLRILRAKDSALKRGAMDMVSRQHFVNISIRSVEEEKQKAQAGFYFLGELASNAVPALIDVFQHPSSSYSKQVAENALMSLYPAKCVAVPYWIAAEERAQWYIQTGNIQSERNAKSNALLAFSEAIRLEPTNHAAYVSRGDAFLQLQDFTGGRIDFESAMALSPGNATPVFGRGLCQFFLNNFKDAEADFTKAINLESNDCRALNFRGLARANLRDFSGALADCNKAIEVEAYDATAYRTRAMVEGMQTEYERALADASKAMELDKRDAWNWTVRSGLQCALKNYKAAAADADRAIRLDRNNSYAYAVRAETFMCMGEFASSAADLETALRLDPKNVTAVLVRAVLRAKRGGEDDAALADFEAAVQLAPHVPEAYGMLGWFQYKLSKWEPALANCRKALNLGILESESSCRAYIWLIRAQSGEEEAANKELETYLKSLDSSKTNDWSALTARFLSGSISERNYLSLAATAARRPSAVTNQVCDSLFYSAMKRKLAGDKPGAVELLQQCLDTRNDNSMAYLNAVVEMRALKGP